MKRIDKAVWIEFRDPQTKFEKGCYGVTDSTDSTAKVFINTKLKTPFTETFFHEMTHVFFSFMNHKVPKKNQELLARKLGRVCAELLK